jgi:hypothetical protein
LVTFSLSGVEKVDKNVSEVSGLNEGGSASLIRDRITYFPEFKIPERLKEHE